MIVLKTRREIELLRDAGRISAEALMVAGEAVKPGVSTWEIDEIARKYILRQGAKPNFLHYNGFPGTACISVNEEVIHGIPSRRRILREGDIVSIDLGALYKGYHGDNAATFAVGRISDEAQRLIDTTRESLEIGLSKAVGGGRVGDIGAAVSEYCVSRGFGVVREYTGHGVGRDLHEDPAVPNYGTAGRGARLLPGMVIAIEPMITMGTHKVRSLPDGWTVVTLDGKYAAHFEKTVAITDGPCDVLSPWTLS